MPRLLRIALAVSLPLLLAAPAAQASSGQLTIFQDDGQLLRRGAAVRDAALDEIKAGGADVVKLSLHWSEVAPGGAAKPEGFRGWELSSYPESAWAPYDGLIRAARARSLRVLVAVSAPAPGWATRGRGDEAGVYRPSAREYGRFVRAVGRRYDGRHSDGAGNPLPRVDFWTIWNEPNHPDFLQPLGSRRGYAIAPHLYRDLVRHAAAGFRLSGHARDTILFGELLPIGKKRFGPRNTIAPVTFIREMACLDSRWRPYRGRAARRRGCHRFRRVSGVDGFGYHPYTRPGGPRVREPSRNDATIRSLSRITRALDRAAARRRLAPRRMRVYVTEFGYQSDPPDPFQTPIRRIPAFLNEAEWLAYRNRRVATWSQYALVDDPVTDASGNAKYSGFQSGLRFADGSEKPGVYDAYRMPLFVRLRGSRTVEVWGAARAAARGETLRIQQRRGSGGWRDLRGGAVRVNSRGYFRKRFRISAPARRRFRAVHVDGGTERTSREARPARR